ncbi:UDP-glycosyltransferase [Flavivirga aquimarina]|uniref:UDP-glycosyltransferase n=1 Tax=Flavivirga aquimarina TaxID=2027862 RepID=A0ABT8WBP0_9FLAO|nr:UDP-glycosyltransferase [Flavivirga aquimarina]MDO5970562.1 UDP-glycosyltransferase [Flavivirga aquimarina]
MSKTSIKILIVAESLDVNDSSATKGRVALIKNLKQCGYELKVFHYTRKHIILPGIECVAILEKKWTAWYWLSKVQLVIKRWFKINLNTFFEDKLGFSFAFFNDVKSIKDCLSKENRFAPDWVLTLSKAASFRSHMAVLKLPNLHEKWLAYVHDPYPMHCYPEPFNWFQPGHKQKEAFFREVSKKASYAIFPSQLLNEWMEQYFSGFLDKSIVIPHQASSKMVSKEVLHPDWFQGDSFTILHAGSLMKPRNPKGLVEGYQLFLSKNPEARDHSQLLLLGQKSYFKAYLDEKNEEISSLYLSGGYIDFNTVLALQNSVSVNVILEAKADISPFLPGKFPHCVMANKPIIHLGPEKSETYRLLGNDYQYHAHIDDIKKITVMIESLYQIWLKNNKTLQLDRQDLEAYISVSNLEQTFSKITKS